MAVRRRRPAEPDLAPAFAHFDVHFEPDLLQALLPPVLDAVVFALAPNTLGLPSLLNLLVAVSRNRVGLRLHVIS